MNNLSSDRPRAAAIALSLVRGGLSGGDIRLKAMLERWQKCADWTIVTSPAGRDNISTWDVDANFCLTHGFPEGLRTRNDVVAQLSNYWFSLDRAALRRFRQSPVEIIYIQSDFTFEVATAVRVKALCPAARMVATCHHSYDEILESSQAPIYRIMRALQRRSYRLMARHADLVMVHPTVTGDRIREDLIKAGVAASCVVRMRNGVDLGVIPKRPSAAEFDACVIGLRSNKGLDDIVPIWEHVCQLRPQATLRIIGNMTVTDREQVERSATQAGIAQYISFAGHFDHPEIYAEIQRSRLCVAPTRQEPYGIAVCEAMACGLPVIGYDLPNYQRLHSGIIQTVACHDTVAFAATIVSVLENEKERESLLKLGLGHIADFDNDQIALEDWRRIVDDGSSASQGVTRRI